MGGLDGALRSPVKLAVTAGEKCLGAERERSPWLKLGSGTGGSE